MNNKVKLINIISIACRAGKVISGEFVIEKTLSGKNNVKLLLLASDVATATKEKYEKLSQNSKTLLRYTELTKDEMANSIGKTDRAAIAICDEGFKKAILKILDN
ncbi:50S ribosomal protein L7 [uncultured Megamonas sp.]|uniref:L7Ae/L30e/S12e/Gadd45 family ribosomal protein n=1 Tax=uncultured Megamonas sp. TaxID=286140 RepID=UPI0025D4BA87|nr:50S ribosomal protein L7 [uncultured Megamonas sp.]